MIFGLSTYELLDIILLLVLLIFISAYLYRKKSNLKKEGILYLYRTQWGVKLIDRIGSKYKKTLRVLSYVSIALGYILMALIVYLMGKTVFLYLFDSTIVEIIKAPPIAPLIPYFPQLFGLGDFFPPFYAIYFIVAILIVATVHEFSHGIFARRFNVKIRSTGFAFLKFFPVIFGAFVEQDDGDMNKKKKSEQMGILSAGVFANVIFAFIFFVILSLFFSLAFVPAGIYFNSYAYSPVSIVAISSISEVPVINPSYEEIIKIVNDIEINETEMIKIGVGDKNYLATKSLLEKNPPQQGLIPLYENAPAINARLESIIIEFNGVEILDYDTLQSEIAKYSPGDEVLIKTLRDDEVIIHRIILEGHPEDDTKPYIGIIPRVAANSCLEEINHFFTSFVQNNLPFKGGVYYESKFGGFSGFIYYLFWWVVLISILVALFNMLPLGILDGGRFFQLTVLGITGSEKFSKNAFKVVTYLILFSILLLMVRWFVARIF